FEHLGPAGAGCEAAAVARDRGRRVRGVVAIPLRIADLDVGDDVRRHLARLAERVSTIGATRYARGGDPTSRFVRRPSLATVLAGLALFVALGGTSMAAVSLVLPANSVGTTQLKNDAVT